MIEGSIRAEYIGMRNDRLGDSRGVRWLGGRVSASGRVHPAPHNSIKFLISKIANALSS